METTEETKKPWKKWVSDIAFMVSIGFIAIAILQSTEIIEPRFEMAWEGASISAFLALVYDRLAKLNN